MSKKKPAHAATLTTAQGAELERNTGKTYVDVEAIGDPVLYPDLPPVVGSITYVTVVTPPRLRVLRCVECGGTRPPRERDPLAFVHAERCDTGAELDELRRRNERRLARRRLPHFHRLITEVERDALASVDLHPQSHFTRVNADPSGCWRSWAGVLRTEPALAPKTA